jgi:uncharacterized protein
MATMTGNHPYGTPCWIDIGVPDVRRAVEFYAAVFGWEVNEGPPEAGGYSMCLVDGRRVAAIAPADDSGGGAYWWNVYFASDDVDASAKRIAEAGGTMVMPPMDVMGQGRMAMAKDPSGAQFGLWRGLAHIGAELVREPGAMSWAELSAPDSGTARAFYAAVLDRPVRDMEVPGFDYATVKAGDADAAGIWGTPGERARWTVYFSVDDTDAAVARVQAAGGSVIRAPEDSPYGRFAIVADPFDADFALLRLPEQ